MKMQIYNFMLIPTDRLIADARGSRTLFGNELLRCTPMYKFDVTQKRLLPARVLSDHLQTEIPKTRFHETKEVLDLFVVCLSAFSQFLFLRKTPACC